MRIATKNIDAYFLRLWGVLVSTMTMTIATKNIDAYFLF